MANKLKTKLEYTDDTKELIKSALQAKGQAITDRDTFRSYVEKITNITDIVSEELTINPTTTTQEFEPSGQYNAYSKVTVNPVTSSIDANIIPENIREGITVLGTTGTLEEGMSDAELIEKLQCIYYGKSYTVPTSFTLNGTTISSLPFDPNEHPVFAFVRAASEGNQIKVLMSTEDQFTGNSSSIYTKFSTTYTSYRGWTNTYIDGSGSISASSPVCISNTGGIYWLDKDLSPEVTSLAVTTAKYEEIKAWVENYKMYVKYGTPLNTVEDLYNAIMADRAYLQPENIRENVTILNTTGTMSEREDLDTELTALENQVAILQVKLNNKTSSEMTQAEVDLAKSQIANLFGEDE